jgi:acetyl esterase/lipase
MRKPAMQIIEMLSLILFFVVATLALAQRRGSTEAMNVPEGVTVHRDIAYVTDGHERQKLDLYVPDEGKNLPLIIWIHGGAWRGGNKTHYVPKAYLNAGYAGASINYRLSQHAIFPAQIEDVKAAVRWLRANSETYRIDPSRFAAWGSSAGGHLVAMLGTTGDIAEFKVGENLHVSSQVQAVVDYYGPTDFLQMDAQRLPDGLVHDAPDSPESQLVGGPIQENKDRVAKANPITYVSKEDPPFLIIHGDQDKLVPYQQSVLLKDALEKAGVSVTFYRVEGGGHGWFKNPRVPELTKAFLEQHLKPTKPK